MSFDIVKVGEDIKMELQSAKVKLPDNYSIENAMKAAYLILKETVDRNKKPVLEACSLESIHTSLLNMAVQGLNPLKDQCYFIAYGSKLVCMRSYMGGQMVAKRVDNRIKDIRAEIIYDGDKFSFSIVNGQKMIKEHHQALGNIKPDRITGGYAMAIGSNEVIIATDIMTIDEIKSSWKQSQMRIVDDNGIVSKGSTHDKFSAEMAKRTVINRLCKRIINTSDDMELLNSARSTEEERALEYSVEAEISHNANQKVIDFKSDEKSDKPAEVAMATKQHAKVIYDLSLQLGQKESMLDNVSGFTGRQIEKLSQLTEKEAESYIDAIENQITTVKEDQPSWG